MKKIDLKTPSSFEPYRSNRFFIEFTSGIEIEPYRVQSLSLSSRCHDIRVLEIVGEVNVVKTLKRNDILTYNVNLIDATGATLDTLSYKGKVKDVNVHLAYNIDGSIVGNSPNEDLLITHISIEVLENLD